MPSLTSLGMSRSNVQEKLVQALEDARTTEPYPVWASWNYLASEVYGLLHSESQQIYLRRAAEKEGIETLKFKNGRCAGACLYRTPEEAWLHKWVLRVTDRGNYAADAMEYRVPTKDEVLRAFCVGLAQPTTPRRMSVAKATQLVNKHCGTDFDLSETAWEVLGYQRNWVAERAEIACRIAQGMSMLLGRRQVQERERRMVTVGPFRVDPATIQHCPCCSQELPSALPASEVVAASPAV